MSGKQPKPKKGQTSAARAAVKAQQHTPKVAMAAGYTIVALSVICGFILSFWPRVFGLQESNPAIGFGIAALAAFRFWALRREIRKQQEP